MTEPDKNRLLVTQDILESEVASLVDSAPETLDTLSELAEALGNDPNFATTVSTEIGKRALVDGAPAAYNTLGKLVTALQNHELGGSTDASLLTGALTYQVDVSDAAVDVTHPVTEDPMGLVSMSYVAGYAIYAAMELAAKSDVGHTHPVTELDATGTRSSSTYLRGDGSWATPANTTYAVPTQAEAEAGTATTARAFSAQRVRQAIAAFTVAKSGTAATLWSGTLAQYNALPAATRNAAGFIAVIQ